NCSPEHGHQTPSTHGNPRPHHRLRDGQQAGRPGLGHVDRSRSHHAMERGQRRLALPPATNDLRTGGTFSSTMDARDGSLSFDFEGVYDDVQWHKRIAYTMSDGRTCEVLFSETEGFTRLVESFDAEPQHSVEMQRAGWQAILDRFKSYVERLS